MINNYLNDIEFKYNIDTPRHWCPQSEKYTGADSLITALRDGWLASRVIYRQDIMHGGSRRTSVYFFELRRDDEVRTMPVISTPFIVRFIASFQMRVIHTADSEKTDVRATAEEPAVRALA